MGYLVMGGLLTLSGVCFYMAWREWRKSKLPPPAEATKRNSTEAVP